MYDNRSQQMNHLTVIVFAGDLVMFPSAMAVCLAPNTAYLSLDNVLHMKHGRFLVPVFHSTFDCLYLKLQQHVLSEV